MPRRRRRKRTHERLLQSGRRHWVAWPQVLAGNLPTRSCSSHPRGRRLDLSTSLFGRRVELPFFTAPAAGNRMFHCEGEVAVASVAREFGMMCAKCQPCARASCSVPIDDAPGLPSLTFCHPTTHISQPHSAKLRLSSTSTQGHAGEPSPRWGYRCILCPPPAPAGTRSHLSPLQPLTRSPLRMGAPRSRQRDASHRRCPTRPDAHRAPFSFMFGATAHSFARFWRGRVPQASRCAPSSGMRPLPRARPFP